MEWKNFERKKIARHWPKLDGLFPNRPLAEVEAEARRMGLRESNPIAMAVAPRPVNSVFDYVAALT